MQKPDYNFKYTHLLNKTLALLLWCRNIKAFGYVEDFRPLGQQATPGFFLHLRFSFSRKS